MHFGCAVPGYPKRRQTYTAKEISSAIGFSISRAYTYSKALGLSVPLPKHTEAQIQFGIYYGHWETVQNAIAPAVRATGEKHV